MAFLRGLGLLAAGVAIGFSWGRSPQWWPSECGAAPDGVSSARARSVLASPPALAGGARPGVEAKLPTPSQVTHDSDADSSPAKRGTLASKRNTLASKRNTLASKRNTLRAKSAPLGAAPDALRFALEQLRKAELLLRAGEPKRALAELDLLDARVPGSVLEEEREVTRTLAPCDAGDVTAASAIAQRLLQRAPGSAYALSLRENCAGKAALLDEMRERTSNPSR